MSDASDSDEDGATGERAEVIDAQALAQASQKAPFGKGNETVVDETVRKTWQIDAANVRILNKDWQVCLDRILTRVAEGLGIAGGPSSICAKLHKMLLYEEGAMFKPHQDTEKVPGMFGTLIVCLPSEHTGGAVCLRHGSKSKRFDSSGHSAFGASYLTWYADVIHEIEPIKTGYRWVLAYNLINQSPDTPRSASALAAELGQFTEALTRWQNLENEPHYLAYPLNHQYTNRDLKLACLKGDDFYRACHVAQSCEAHGAYYMILGNMEMRISSSGDYENVEEEEAVLSLDHIVDAQGYDLLISSTRSISTANLLCGGSYEDRDPDVQHEGGYMGNEYAENEQLFKDSTLIIVQRREILNFLLGRTFTCHALAQLVTRLRGITEQAADSSFRHLLLQICQLVLERYGQNTGDKDLHLGPVAVAAAFLEDSKLFHTIASAIESRLEKSHYSTLGELVCIDDPSVQENETSKPVRPAASEESEEMA
ncbi:MAG: hypothetical protein Q9168_006301 [Polycauliona sp. 1 TL-2023]